jgi:hypothetical protein
VFRTVQEAAGLSDQKQLLDPHARVIPGALKA